jgi:hypothetical protein
VLEKLTSSNFFHIEASDPVSVTFEIKMTANPRWLERFRVLARFVLAFDYQRLDLFDWSTRTQCVLLVILNRGSGLFVILTPPFA